jgi:hypothetical protein
MQAVEKLIQAGLAQMWQCSMSPKSVRPPDFAAQDRAMPARQLPEPA